jgi:hypothetical protein
VRPDGLDKLKKKKRTPHRVPNPRPSRLQHNALTTTLPRVPKLCLEEHMQNSTKGLELLDQTATQ